VLVGGIGVSVAAGKGAGGTVGVIAASDGLQANSKVAIRKTRKINLILTTASWFRLTNVL
jgi:hypothetical protein